MLVVPLPATERQLTHAPHGHVLTNVNVWSPDSRWIVYDVRTQDSAFTGTRIEQVNIDSGAVQLLYESRDGAACGVVTYHPQAAKVVFIHGPENPSAEWTYGASRRRGAVVEVAHPGVVRPLDAMTYAPPFKPGALRGGSHVHVFSPDGACVSYTYEDDVLARLGSTGDHDRNQRTVGVAVPAGPEGVQVGRTHPRNHDGDFFNVIVARTVDRPRPGSDDINKAWEEGWVAGPAGRRALAFLGQVTAADGREHAEVFIADLPADLTRVGAGPLEGTARRRPAPPQGVTQRRLTFTADRKFPGVVTSPRHWVRASPDGRALAFLMKDDAGVGQFWTVAPAGGPPRQVTQHATGIASAFTWSPDGTRLAHVLDGCVCVTEVATGRVTRLTERGSDATAPLALACVFSPDGRHIAFLRNLTRDGATFSHVCVVSVPSP